MEAPPTQAIDLTYLRVPLRRMMGLDQIDDISWQVAQMKGGVGNPVSLGLYRFYGRVLVQDRWQAFTLVLKVIQSPANSGLVGIGEGDDPTHWNYWQREPLFYQSDLVSQMPPGLAVPQCYGVQQWDNQVAWLWLEEIPDGSDDLQQLEALGFLAYQLGRFNGKFAHPDHLPDAPWLGRNTLRQWLKPVEGVSNPLMARDGRPNWQHPYVQAMYAHARGHAYRRFWDDLELFLGILPTLPPTWCHGDGASTNFKIRQTGRGDKEVVALDWALTNVGVVGEDVAQLVYGAYDSWPVDEWDSAINLLLGRYLSGLRQAGWQGDERDVWLGFALTVLIKYGIFIFFIIGLGLTNEGENLTPPEQHKLAAHFLQRVAQMAHEFLGRKIEGE